ncbi:BQ5605_C001g00103 [Microbotryum silenes-dioicae]|uniref:BQ5605_C001g00103 protein n=1 Tax=Microbotryum silenes-dioicae TaxID=796604 RepID=A0A2X0M293_9BASI|nr:BQ5605_C001g00103 [Microbotryum silenes-dioicae]
MTESVSQSPTSKSPTDHPAAGPSQPSSTEVTLNAPVSASFSSSGDDPQRTARNVPSSDLPRSNRSLPGPSSIHGRDFAAKAPGTTLAGSGESVTSSRSSSNPVSGSGSGSATPNLDSRGHQSNEPGDDDDKFGPSHMSNLIQGFAGMIITLPSLFVEVLTNANSASVKASPSVAQAVSETTQKLAESSSSAVHEGVDTALSTSSNIKDQTVGAFEEATNSATTRTTLGHRLSDWFNWSSPKANEQDATVMMDESEILRAQLEQEIDRSFSGSKDEEISVPQTKMPFNLGSSNEGGDAQPARSESSNLDGRDSSSRGERSDRKGRSTDVVEDSTLSGESVKPSEAAHEDEVRRPSPQHAQRAQGSKQVSEKSDSGEVSRKAKGRDEQRHRGEGHRSSPSKASSAGQLEEAKPLQDFEQSADVQFEGDASSIPASTQHSHAASSTLDKIARPQEVQRNAQGNLAQPDQLSGGLSPSGSVAPALPEHLQSPVGYRPHHEREEQSTPARSSFDDLKDRFAKFPSTKGSEQESTGVSLALVQQPQQTSVRRDSPPATLSALPGPAGSVGLAADHKQFEQAAPVDLARSEPHGTWSTAEHEGE